PPSAAWWLPALSSTARSSPSKTLGPPRRLTSGLLPFARELLTDAPPRPNSRHRGWFEKGAPFLFFSILDRRNAERAVLLLSHRVTRNDQRCERGLNARFLSMSARTRRRQGLVELALT